MKQNRPGSSGHNVLPLTWMLLVSEVLLFPGLIIYGLQSWGNIVNLLTGIVTWIVVVAGLIMGLAQIGDHSQQFWPALKGLGVLHWMPFKYIQQNWLKLWRRLLVALFVLLIGALLGARFIPDIPWFHSRPPTSASLQPLTFSQQMPDGETIGISEGGTAFDVASRDGKDSDGHRDGELKKEAAAAYGESNFRLARNYWMQAVDIQPGTGNPDSDDAEVKIYLEDLNVKESGYPYITLIVAVPLTGVPAAYNVGRDDLQAAYIEQLEFNQQHGEGPQMLLLIANIGTGAIGAPAIAERIQRISGQRDNTLAAGVGWPTLKQTTV